MVGWGSGRAARWFAALALLAVAAVAEARPDYGALAPSQLVRAWKSTPREDRSALIEALLTRRAEILPALRDAARNGDPADKIFACTLIGEMRDRDGADSVMAATADADVKVRRRATTVLRVLNVRRAAPRLRELVRTDADFGVLKTALAALGRLADPRDVALIAPFIDHSDDGVRIVAAGSLAMLGDERGLDLVIQATHSEDPGVQKNATYALGLFRAAEAAERVQAILDDPNGAWRGYALIARAERELAVESAADQVATLEELARGRSRTAAEWAVDRLTDIGDARSVAVLRKVREKSTPVSAMAERRLKILGAQP
jgi:HEAT repeat protein